MFEALEVGESFKVVVKDPMKLRGYMARTGVQYEVDRGGMLGRLPEVATDSGAVIPFGLGVAGLKGEGQDEGWGTEWVEVVSSGANGNARELFDW